MEENNISLSNELLDHYDHEIRSVIKTKLLFLRPNLSMESLANEIGISADNIRQVINKKLHSTFFDFISDFFAQFRIQN